ncbi:GNAT family N-acetyltransferase [Nocardioides plantarum]|uniref:GNAT family N-acetyltransferase n=1 Tax=Nocardioides plantarum TaxID=29299 RepID=A0ABV5K900_9ACTN|nr:GNAT family N-acetyltransferase [Nocardioides plantarum]
MTVARLAGPAEAELLVDLHEACWREAYAGLIDPPMIDRVFADRPAALARRRAHLADPTTPTWVVEHDGRLVGFATAGPPRDLDPPAGLELRAIYARASVWGTGVGRALLAASIGDAAAYLWVLEGNDRAVGFYRRQGFELDGATEEHEEGLHLRMCRPG